MAVYVTTDIHGLDRVSTREVKVFAASEFPNAWDRRWRLFRSALRSDHLVIHFALPDVMFFTLLLALTPGHRCKLTTLDFFIGDLQRRSRQSLVRWCLGRVDRFLVYFKNSGIYEQALRVPGAKFFYVPFKINALELIQAATTSDRGYIFCGGRSRRDFATLFAAVEALGYPLTVITSREAEMTQHGSTLEGVRVPPNVTVLTEDSLPEFFVQCMAGARVVVIPVLRDSTTQAGIGVYLQGMALGKCVIVSAGLGVSDVIEPDPSGLAPAWIVEPGNVDELREALRTAWENPELRERYGKAAAHYALPLGGEDQLRRTILKSLP